MDRMRGIRNAWGPLVARLLLALLFFTSSIAKIGSWNGNVQYVRSHHLPWPGAMLAGALAAEIVTWAGLVTGYRARLAAAVGFLYLIPVTFVFHAVLSTNFQKNLGMMGGLLMVAVCGPGRVALGARAPSAGAGRPAPARV